MKREEPSRPAGISRRGFLGLASAAVGLCVRPVWAEASGAARAGDRAPLEREHQLDLRLPRVTASGAKVPIVVEMAHPMTPDHHIVSVRVTNESDPISSKGTFHFTPENGRVHLAFQARMHHGTSEVSATAECNRHGTWSSCRSIEIPAGAGGCTGAGAPPFARTAGADVGGPVIRIPELVERGRIRRGEIIHVQVKMRHPNRTGLVFRDGAFVQESEPIHLDDMEVRYGGKTVSRFNMTAALSDDPFIAFALLASREAPIEVVLTNNRGQRFEARHDVAFA